MELIDKRTVCECHQDCSTVEHYCAKPCIWPLCLTEAEHHALVAGVMSEYFGEPPFPAPGAST